ncbi:MAG: MAE_28990/MAE_18760 family HEPN-like nuclease [Desulfobaccales bacterium]
MARYTSAYSSFIFRLTEVDLLRRFAATKEKVDPVKLRDEINAFCRGAVVLLSAHVEAFIKELGEVALTNIHLKAVSRNSLASQFYYHISKDTISEVKDTSDHGRIAEKIFGFLQSDLTYWDRTGPFPNPLPSDRFNSGFSNPAFDKIRAYFNRFGYQDYQKDLAATLQANFNSTKNMVDHLVDTRNKIAHGDIDISTKKTPDDVKQMIVIIRKFCGATDAVFASWCNMNLCPIR